MHWSPLPHEHYMAMWPYCPPGARIKGDVGLWNYRYIAIGYEPNPEFDAKLYGLKGSGSQLSKNFSTLSPVEACKLCGLDVESFPQIEARLKLAQKRWEEANRQAPTLKPKSVFGVDIPPTSNVIKVDFSSRKSGV